MKMIYFDSLGGASGDMILACLLDLGADLKKIRAVLEKTVKDRFAIEVKPVRQNGLRGLQVKVNVPHHGGHGSHPPSSRLSARSGLRRVSQKLLPSVADCHGMLHRNLDDIEKMINTSKLSPFVRERALNVFRRLAKAEAKAHGVKPSKIHFHEVGAMDSIIDIIGSCLALEQIGAERVAVGPLPLGCGTIKCAHGILPSPAPATVELLKGFAISQTDEPFELVTPTGAALLTTWKNAETAPAGAKILRTGYGFGHFKLNLRPNLLRATLLDCEKPEKNSGQCLVLECNLDDMTPELIGSLFSRLLEEGALDVFITPVQMKKNRPGAMLTILCSPDKRDKMFDLIFRESTTFGVREHDVRRTVLPRHFETVKTPYGNVRVKIGLWKGKEITRAPEYEDCRKLAEKANVPVRRVYEAALALVIKRGG